MGIKNFIKFVEKYSPNAIKYTNIWSYQNKTIGIDANLLLYKLIFAIRANGYDIMNNDIIVTHIHALLLKLLAFMEYKINPVFVFDSRAPLIKQKTLDDRKKTKENLIEKYKSSNTEKGKRIYYYIKTDLTEKEINECRELIEIFGYTIIDAKEESDAQLAELYKEGLINYIASDDMDILLFGGGILLKNFSVAENRKIQEINLQEILNSANITMDELIEIGILMGSDYCNNPTHSATKAYELVKSGQLDELQNCHDAINYFTNPPVYHITSLSINTNIKSRELKEFLESFNFKNSYIDNIFKTLRDI